MPTRRTLLTAALKGAAGLALAPLLPAVPAAAAGDPVMSAFRTLCLQVARSNVVNGRPIPSQAYPQGTWVRDAYWTMAALGDRDLQRRTWHRFAAVQDKVTGRAPSAVLNDDRLYYANDDESTALFVLLALDLTRAGVAVEGAPLEGAARYLLSRLDAHGAVRSGPGPGSWWLDTLILGTPDTVSYTQGVTAVALRALTELGVRLPSGVAEQAETAYAALYQPDLQTMTLSAGTTLLDVSCLAGEHLSLHLFGRKLLSDEAVANTLSAFRRVDYPDDAFLGFPIATNLDGTYMPMEWFSPAPDDWPGYYHNGGSWLLYDALALDAGRRHGVSGADDLLRARIQSETRSAPTLHEYLATTEDRGQLGDVPFTWRTGYAWNSYVATLI